MLTEALLLILDLDILTYHLSLISGVIGYFYIDKKRFGLMFYNLFFSTVVYEFLGYVFNTNPNIPYTESSFPNEAILSLTSFWFTGYLLHRNKKFLSSILLFIILTSIMLIYVGHSTIGETIGGFAFGLISPLITFLLVVNIKKRLIPFIAIVFLVITFFVYINLPYLSESAIISISSSLGFFIGWALRPSDLSNIMQKRFAVSIALIGAYLLEGCSIFVDLPMQIKVALVYFIIHLWISFIAEKISRTIAPEIEEEL